MDRKHATGTSRTQILGSRTRSALACVLAACALALPCAASAQAGLTVTPTFQTDEFIPSNGTIEFRVDGAPETGMPELAVFVGNVDVSALVTRDGNTFSYTPALIRLPSGEQEVTVYNAGDGNWTEVGRIPIRVLTRLGFEQVRYDPRLAIENTGQIAESHSLDQLAPERETYQDFTFRIGFESDLVRPGLTVRSQVNTVGASNRQQALRFGLEQDDAPKYDLADYLVRAGAGRTTLSVGHVAAGSNRHLINSFSSRGLTLESGVGPLSAKVGAMNGSSIVGWSNPVGLGESGHRILSGEIGIDPLENRSGTLRLDATVVDGSVLPLTGFNQDAIVNAETSRGFGFQLTAADPSGRVRFNGGYARSEYDDTEDQTLTRGETLVIIRDETRNARYLDLSVDVLRGLKLGETTFASLSTAVRHERIDPLYRSVASYTQSDLQENGFDVTASVGPVNARFGLSRRRDNLEEIPSILTTRTRTQQASLAMPFGVLVGQSANTWLPQLSYNLNRVHQFGDGIPENSGFSASHVPDQLSTVHGVTAQWFRSTWQLMYRLDRSTQDNRQEGREGADFERTSHSVTLGLNPWQVVGFSIDGSTEENVSAGRDETSTTRRFGLTANVRPFSRTGVTLFGSQSWSEDPFDAGEERVVRQIRVELSQTVTLLTRQSGATTGQLFLRFAHQQGDLFGLATGETPSAWTLNTGFNLSLF